MPNGPQSYPYFTNPEDPASKPKRTGGSNKGPQETEEERLRRQLEELQKKLREEEQKNKDKASQITEADRKARDIASGEGRFARTEQQIADDLGIRPEDVPLLIAGQQDVRGLRESKGLVEEEQQEAREEAAAEAFADIRAELEAKTTPGQEPTVRPESLGLVEGLTETTGQEATFVFSNAFNAATGQETLTTKEFDKTVLGKATNGLKGAAVAGALGLIAKGGATAFTAARSLLVKASGGAIGGINSGLLAGVGGVFGVGKLTDIGKGKINDAVSALSEYNTAAGTIIDTVETGGDPRAAKRKIEELINDVNEAEEKIRTVAALNLQFRNSNEYLDIDAKIRETRLELLAKAGELQNLIATGKKDLDPQGLLLSLEEIKELNS